VTDGGVGTLVGRSRALPERSPSQCWAAVFPKEGAHGGTMGSPMQNEWGYSCRLVDLIGKLL
jgi:hypothetical protein